MYIITRNKLKVRRHTNNYRDNRLVYKREGDEGDHTRDAISETAKLQQKAEYENQIPMDLFNLGLLHDTASLLSALCTITRVDTWKRIRSDRKLQNDSLCCPTKYRSWATIARIDCHHYSLHRVLRLSAYTTLHFFSTNVSSTAFRGTNYHVLIMDKHIHI